MTNRIKELRQEKKLTQKDIAKLLNVSDRSVGFYESGKRDPDTETLKKLADFFDVSIDYLLGRTNISNQIQEEKTEYEIDDKFTDEELKLIQKYRQSSDKGKKIIETIAEIESNDEQAATGI